MTELALGLDIGGTKLAAGVVDLTEKRLIDAGSTDTPASAGSDVICDTILSLADQLDSIDKIDRIGVSFGGHVRQSRILRSVQVAGWSDYPLEATLLNHFGKMPCRIANDGNAMALGEWHFGAGRGSDSMLYILVGTGIGSGIVIGGQLLEGSSGMAGEFGHYVALPGGPLCPCGKQGCLEAVAAGPAIVREAGEMLSSQSNMQSALRGKSPLTAKLIAESARQSDTIAVEVITKAAFHLGTALGSAVNLLDVERVVIGGGVSRSGDLWWDTLTEAARAAILPWRSDLDIRRSELGEYEGVWAAVSLVY
jgi:glucokinase